MCANFKPISLLQVQQLGLLAIPFLYEEEIFPSFQTPLLFKSDQGMEWRLVNFGLVPKWAEDKDAAKHTYNARNETLMEKRSFVEAFSKCQFGVIPVTEFYESKYINGRPQRWGEWLGIQQPNILSFIEGFPVAEFECFYCPKRSNNKNSPQLNIFDEES